MIENAGEFIGFLCGIISQDHDLEAIFLDSFLKVAVIEPEEVESVIQKIKSISKQFHIDFYISVSMNSGELPESLQSEIMVAL